MTFALTDFKSGLAQGGARPSLFKVKLSYPSPITTPQIGTFNSSELLVKSTTIPSSTLGTYEVFYHGKSIKVAGDGGAPRGSQGEFIGIRAIDRILPADQHWSALKPEMYPVGTH